MGYKVKWVEDNIGVSRKALRGFERIGLMPNNEGGQYRDYSDEDIERIWEIRVLQGVGYKLKEIVDIASNEDFDFIGSINEKIMQLEKDKVEIERHIGYAKAIKFTGRIPAYPKKMGSVRFDDFYEKSLNNWNVNNEPQVEKYQDIIDTVLMKPQEEWQDTDLGRMLDFFGNFDLANIDIEAMMTEKLLPKEISKRMSLGASHTEVQLLVNMIYDNVGNINPKLKELTRQQFARFYSSIYMEGDVARLKQQNYGKEGCVFIADAVAIFGGYTDYDSIEI